MVFGNIRKFCGDHSYIRTCTTTTMCGTSHTEYEMVSKLRCSRVYFFGHNSRRMWSYKRRTYVRDTQGVYWENVFKLGFRVKLPCFSLWKLSFQSLRPISKFEHFIFVHVFKNVHLFIWKSHYFKLKPTHVDNMVFFFNFTFIDSIPNIYFPLRKIEPVYNIAVEKHNHSSLNNRFRSVLIAHRV